MAKRVLLAAPRGYCAGVDRAVVTVEKALALSLTDAAAASAGVPLKGLYIKTGTSELRIRTT